MKIKHSLICLLIIGTTVLTAANWHLGMMGMTTFLLAYFSKGLRRRSHINGRLAK
ncbi:MULTISPECIES: hypothetical protein [Nostocales]|uniref:Uncharacterized protein n=3 Tax=Nostocales TaxID=1161 RepID=A0A8S9T391_9CYAN|nr:hypothetical protein [Tolypothrix bouteillei]KAF3886019.1 hypothetical protein DA73_0400011455 [Tolypothrix bouteillei VB521301]